MYHIVGVLLLIALVIYYRMQEEKDTIGDKQKQFFWQ